MTTHEIDLEWIATAAARECIKQEVGLHALAGLIEAYDYAIQQADRPPTKHDVKILALHVEFDTSGSYRRITVRFSDHLDTPPHHSTVETAISRLFDQLERRPRPDTDEFVKAFLGIHPFIDGNGRVAWILLNWLNGTLEAPTPLPDYFGQATP